MSAGTGTGRDEALPSETAWSAGGTSARAILRQQAHRPWPLPKGPWALRQTWGKLLFAHWPVEPEALRPLLPAALELETWEGEAWVGVVPFRMSGVRPHWLPSVPGASAFPELNLRTYVRAAGKSGVWFFSLDAGNALAVAVARATFHLPYFTAHMRADRDGAAIAYASRRVHRRAPSAHFIARFQPCGPPTAPRPGTLVHFLTERYCLFAADARGRLFRADIHHGPWALQPAEVEIAENTMAAASGIALPDCAPLLHYAERQDALAWMPHRVNV